MNAPGRQRLTSKMQQMLSLLSNCRLPSGMKHGRTDMLAVRATVLPMTPQELQLLPKYHPPSHSSHAFHTPMAFQEDAKYTSTPSFLREGCQLHPYQLEGLNWLKFKWDMNENVILADEMGLGKTIQAVAFLTALWDDCVYLPHLVVVPLSTMQNWQREFETWAPQLRVVAVHGTKAARHTILNHEIYLSKNTKKSKKRRSNKSEDMNRRIKCHVILTSYEVVSLESTKLGKIEYECMIVDEGHRLKGRSSKLVKVRRVRKSEMCEAG